MCKPIYVHWKTVWGIFFHSRIWCVFNKDMRWFEFSFENSSRRNLLFSPYGFRQHTLLSSSVVCVVWSRDSICRLCSDDVIGWWRPLDQVVVKEKSKFLLLEIMSILNYWWNFSMKDMRCIWTSPFTKTNYNKNEFHKKTNYWRTIVVCFYERTRSKTPHFFLNTPPLGMKENTSNCFPVVCVYSSKE